MAYVVSRTCFLLALLIDVTKAFNLGQTIVKSDILPSSQYLIAPELFRDGSFAFAVVKKPEQKKDSAGIDISMSIADKHSSDFSKCLLTLKPNEDANSVTVTSLRRLSDKKVVLVGYETDKDDKRKGLLVLMDLKNCEPLYFYSSYDLADNYVLVTRENSDRFEIFMRRHSPHPSCIDDKGRISFEPGRKQFHCFEVDLDWSGIYIGQFSFSEDVVLVRGFDITGSYKVMVYNTAVYPYKQQLWLRLPQATNKTEVASSDLAVCWILNPDLDKTIHCTLIDKSGNTRLNKTLIYEEPVTLLSISHSEHSSDIIVLTEKIQCEDADCGSVFISKLSDESTSHREIKLDCFRNNKKRLIIKARQIVSKGAIALQYVCEDHNRFVLHSIILDDS